MNLVEAVKAAGIVGEGGAGFPTHVKLSAKADCFIVNASECEPLIETDKYLSRTFAHKIISATDRIGEHLGAYDRVIALKSKYTEEIASLSRAIDESGSRVRLFEMPSFYPAGDEQTIVQMLCGRSVPERSIPLDVGAVVNNVGTLVHIYDAMNGVPVTDKYLSVVGEVERPLMLHVPIGTPLTDCIRAAVPKTEDFAVILGGPMMGRVVTDIDEIRGLSVLKTTGNILVLSKEHYLIKRSTKTISSMKAQARSACIQCRMCTDLCPRNLLGHKIRPHLIMRNLYRESVITDIDEYRDNFGDAVNCCDCGVCELFSCPMGLAPCRVNKYIKQELRVRGIQVARGENPTASRQIEYRRIPSSRLIARLGLMKYSGQRAEECVTLSPAQVYIPFQQHIGRPALAVRALGERVVRGELLAEAAPDALSANIHAGISGVITEIDTNGAVISGGEV